MAKTKIARAQNKAIIFIHFSNLIDSEKQTNDTKWLKMDEKLWQKCDSFKFFVEAQVFVTNESLFFMKFCIILWVTLNLFFLCVLKLLVQKKKKGKKDTKNIKKKVIYGKKSGRNEIDKLKKKKTKLYTIFMYAINM